MTEIAHYHLGEGQGNDWRCFGSSLRYNRVLYGGHQNDDSPRRFFTFAGDAPIFMGALSDYKINNWCYQAKCGVLQSGLALTPGVVFDGTYSRWFHNYRDILSTWKHGTMEYRCSAMGNYFPETATKIEIVPLQEEDGFCVNYDILADGQIIFCAVFGGMSGFAGRYDNLESTRRDLSLEDCQAAKASITKRGYGCLRNPELGTVSLIANDFGAELELDGAAAAMEKMPSLALNQHEGEAAVIKMSRRLMAGEHLQGRIIVLVNGTEKEMAHCLAAKSSAKDMAGIAAKTTGIKMKTGDARLDGSVPDMQIALDASYHKPTFNHGAVGYHAPFLGWRGWYAASDAGWFDRVRGAIRAHLKTMQRSKRAEKVWYDGADRPDLDHEGTQYHHIQYSNGRLTPLLDSDDIYDMQEVAVDMTFHYLERSGDLELGREIFDDLAEILGWEARVLDYDNDGLYQNFLNTWISDGHVYNGGGCAQASFYNYYANCEMVRLGKAIGRDTAIFEERAAKTLKALQAKLWIKEKGIFAEYVDTIGNRLLHPSPELSTIYLASESGAATQKQMSSILRFSETDIRSTITPNRKGRLAYSANWLPKKYSTCGLFPAENAALALAYFRNRDAVAGEQILNGLLDALALSTTPGTISHVVAASGAADHGDLDFTDVTSTYLRLLVEGLWGVRYKMLSNELEIGPQLPESISADASLEVNDLSLAYQRSKSSCTLVIKSTLSCEKRVILPGAAKGITCNGKLMEKKIDRSGAEAAAIIKLPAKGAKGCWIIRYSCAAKAKEMRPLNTALPLRKKHAPAPKNAVQLDCSALFNAEITGIYKREFLSPRPKGYSIGARKCGRYAWEWNHYGHNEVVINDDALRKAPKGIYSLPSGWAFKTPAKGNNVACVSIWDNFPTELTMPLSGKAKELAFAIIGGTNAMQNGVVNAEIEICYKDGTSTVSQLINPKNFDDFLLVNSQLEDECFYFAPGCHGSIHRVAVNSRKELASVTIRAVANEVILGLLALFCCR